MSSVSADDVFVRRILSGDICARDTGWGEPELRVAWSYLLALDTSVMPTQPLHKGAVSGEQIGELLHGGQPISLDVLRGLKMWAQNVMRGNHQTPVNGEPVPPQTASALYHLAIVLAMLWHDARISSMDDRALAEGVRWAAKQGWIDEKSREILSQWLVRASA